MKTKSLLALLTYILLGFNSFAQPPKKIGVGDKMPNVEIKKLVNYSSSAAKLSDFTGKLIILDFWATWCSPCVAAFPKLNDLQAKYASQVEILPVTREDETKVKMLFTKLSNLKGKTFHSVVEDKAFSELFDYVELPHYVWIDKTGKVVAITDGLQVTEENINKVISGQSISLPIKKETAARVITKFGKEPVFSPSSLVKLDSVTKVVQVPKSSVLINSVLTQYVDGLVSASSVSEDSTLITITNNTIEKLYRKALWQHGLEVVNSSKTLVEVADSALYKIITGTHIKTSQEWKIWQLDNVYCYELKIPPALAKNRFDIMVADLNKYFGSLYGIEGLMEKRNQKYLALVRINKKENQFATKGGQEVLQQNKVWLKAVNVPMTWFLTQLRQPLQFYPYIENETGYEGNIDIEINCSLGDLSALNKELEKAGLKFIEREKKADIAVIRMKKQ
jgi:thiol-disulfide isomerase/thioredoxin